MFKFRLIKRSSRDKTAESSSEKSNIKEQSSSPENPNSTDPPSQTIVTSSKSIQSTHSDGETTSIPNRIQKNSPKNSKERVQQKTSKKSNMTKGSCKDLLESNNMAVRGSNSADPNTDPPDPNIQENSRSCEELKISDIVQDISMREEEDGEQIRTGSALKDEEAWNTQTGLCRAEFEMITKYFSLGNNRLDNMNRAKMMGFHQNVKIAPGANLRLADASFLHPNVYIGAFTYINGEVLIEEDVTIGPQCSLTSNNHLFNPSLQNFKVRPMEVNFVLVKNILFIELTSFDINFI